MRAIARCEECGQDLETTCRTCIEAGIDYHRCQGGFQVKKVDWRAVPGGRDES